MKSESSLALDKRFCFHQYAYTYGLRVILLLDDFISLLLKRL